MSKEIKVSILTKTKLSLQSDAKAGDYVDLNNIENTYDSSVLESIFNEIKDNKIEQIIAKRVQEKEQIFEAQKQLSIKNEIASKMDEINNLKNQISNLSVQHKIEVNSIKTNLEREKNTLELRIESLNESKQNAIVQKELEYKELVNDYKKKIEQLERNNKWSQFQNWDIFPDGGLENYCYNFYINHIKKYWPQIEFKKDTNVIDGTKGDFVLEENNNGFIFSISFEMKNEKTNNIKGLKISKHYPQANINRNKKNCKYSVIVTTLEPEAEFNIRKIDEYDDMWVIRPEFFEDIITQLRDKELSIFMQTKNLSEQLEKNKLENLELDKFESRIDKFKDSFTNHWEKAGDKFVKAISEIDKTITNLNNVRASLVASNEQLNRANDDLDLISIKKLTHGTPTVAKLLESAKKK